MKERKTWHRNHERTKMTIVVTSIITIITTMFSTREVTFVCAKESS